MLFIALLVMVALSLAGIALIRSADTATIVAGNLAFKQAAASAVDRSIEQAIEALFDPVADPALSNPVIADKKADLLAQNYFACVQDDAGGCLPPTLRFRRFRTRPDDHDEVRRRRPQRRPGPGRRRRQQELLRDRAHVRESRARRSAATAICRAPRWARTPERSTTRAWSAPATPSTASRSASKAPATRWRMRRRFSDSPRAIPGFPGAAP